MLRKVLSVILSTIILCFSFTGCNNKEKAIDTNNYTSSTSEIISETGTESQTENISTNADNKSNSSEKQIIVEDNSKKYYLSGSYCFTSLNDDNTVSIIEYKDNSESKSLPINAYKCVYGDNMLYVQQKDDLSQLYKYKINENSLEQSVWVDNETLKNSVVGNTDYGYSGNMTDWFLYDGYVYFLCIPSMDYFMSEKTLSYHLGKISLDGKLIEFIGDTIASSFTIKDGWIYYFDNGYVCNERDSNYYFDFDRVGIYRMKTDGSDKELLLGNFESDPDIEHNILCDNINIYDDYVFFTDYSSRGNSKVCKMKTDGTEFETVTANGAFWYTIDDDIIYYATGEKGMSEINARTVYELSLSGGNEKPLFGLKMQNDIHFCAYQGCLYSMDIGVIIKNVNSRRYNLEKGEMEYMYYKNSKCYWETNEGYEMNGLTIY